MVIINLTLWPGLFWSTLYLWDFYVLCCVSIFHLFPYSEVFLYLNYCSLSVLLMDTWFVSSFWQLWKVLLWTFPEMKKLYTFLLGIYVGEESLGHRVSSLPLMDTVKQFFKVFVHFALPPTAYGSSSCSISLPTLDIFCFVFFILAMWLLMNLCANCGGNLYELFSFV